MPENRGNHLVWDQAWQGFQPASQGLVAARVPARQPVELFECTLMPFHHSDSLPDAELWSEIIYVIAGSLTLVLEQQTLTLEAGQTQVFNSDQHYAYANHSQQPLRFIRNVTF